MVDPHLKPLKNSGFTKYDHIELDKDIINRFNLHRWTANDYCTPSGIIVLRAIIDQIGAPATALKSFSELEKLIKEKPALLEMLQKGAQQGFRSVRLARILWDDAAIEEGMLNTEPMIGPSTGAAQWAWDSKYRGDYAKVLQDNINSLPRSSTHANCISIIQSDGYGKSRMVDELAKLVFTIPLNLRYPDWRDGAYPQSDSSVWHYFCKTSIEGVDDAQRLVAVFFGNLFGTITNEILGAFHGREPVPQETFAQQWQEYLLQDSSGTHDSNRGQLYHNVVDVSSKRPCGSFKNLATTLHANLNGLLGALGKFCKDQSPAEGNKRCVQMILYFDAAYELDRRIGHGKVLFDAVCSVLAKFRSPTVFTIFLSTEKVLSNPQHNPLWGPVTETPFDCHPIFPLKSGQYGLAEVSHPIFMIKFGRPLFWTMFDREEQKDEPNNPELLNSMMELARVKLLLKNDIHAKASSCSPEARTVVLDILITYDYEPRSESSHKLQLKLIAGHMRTAYSFPYQCVYPRSGYPSEPFLAEAASRQLHHFMKAEPSFAADDLIQKIKDGLIDLSQRGEVVMRLLLRKAYMDAVVAEQGKDPNFSGGCSLVEFLKALFAQRYGTKVEKLKPSNVTKSLRNFPLANVFKDAIVRFTHFSGAANEDAMTTTGMVMGFLRGTAIIGWDGQERVDIAIPILMNKDDKIEEASMSALLIQVRRQRRRSPNAFIIDAVEMDFFTGKENPYVTLVVELGTEAPSALEGNVRFEEPPADACDGQNGPPRYSIWAYECTHETWKVVAPREEEFYKQIVGLDDQFADHPRQDATSLNLVHRMLPSWGANPTWIS